MRKILTAGAMALTALGALGATAAPADAQGRGGFHGGGGGFHGGGGGFHGGGFHGGGWHGGHGYGWGVGAGLAGFALGAAIASPYYYGGYYGPGYGYYGPGYYDGYYGYDGPACYSTRRVWDPYYGGYVIRHFRYAC